MSLLSLLIFLIVAGVVVWAARQLMAAFGIGDPIATVVFVILVVIILIAFLNFVGVNTGLNLRL